MKWVRRFQKELSGFMSSPNGAIARRARARRGRRECLRAIHEAIDTCNILWIASSQAPRNDSSMPMFSIGSPRQFNCHCEGYSNPELIVIMPEAIQLPTPWLVILISLQVRDDNM